MGNSQSRVERAVMDEAEFANEGSESGNVGLEGPF